MEYQIYDIVFLKGYYVWLGIVSVFFVLFGVFYMRKKYALPFHFLVHIKKSGFNISPIYWLKNILLGVLIITFFLLFADPHKKNVQQKVSKEGIDIVLALDISKSMEAQDLEPNRIEAAKKVMQDFISEMTSDRIGLVVFAGKPFSSVPLTYDYNILSEIISDINTDTLNQNISGLDGTAIGDAILLGANLLEGDDEKREKIIIVLTDGDANRGVEPILATKSLSDKNIKIYSIGIGSREGGIIQFQNGPFVQEQRVPPLKEDTLREIARLSKAQFFRAIDTNSLENIFSEIAKLEKTEIELMIEKTYVPYYAPFVYILITVLGMLVCIEIIYRK